MGYNKATSDALIERMQILCNRAMATEEGIKIQTSSESEAIRLRQQIYAARREVRKRNPTDTSPVSIVELRINTDHLLILKPGALTSQWHISDIATGKQISAVPKEEEIKEVLRSNTRIITDAEVFDVMLRLAEKKGPGDHETEARAWLESGKTLEDL